MTGKKTNCLCSIKGKKKELIMAIHEMVPNTVAHMVQRCNHELENGPVDH